MTKSTFAGAAAAAFLALAPAAGLAQNETVPANVTATTTNAPATQAPDTAAPQSAPPAATDPAIPPATGIDNVITTTTAEPVPVDAALPPMEPVNPYANSYDELEPLMVEEDRGFDDWGLFGLLGLLGLIGLMGRRERIIYVERDETRVYRAPGEDLPRR